MKLLPANGEAEPWPDAVLDQIGEDGADEATANHKVSKEQFQLLFMKFQFHKNLLELQPPIWFLDQLLFNQQPATVNK